LAGLVVYKGGHGRQAMILDNKQRKLYGKVTAICVACTCRMIHEMLSEGSDTDQDFVSDRYECDSIERDVTVCRHCLYAIELELLLDQIGLVEVSAIDDKYRRWIWKTSVKQGKLCIKPTSYVLGA